MSELRGFLRRDGRSGARNHILVLPSVVCATHVAVRAVGSHQTVVHQHGCAHVGDDLIHTKIALVGLATNPNVRAVVVVSLGCETLSGRSLADEIEAAGQRVEFVGIQSEGGSERAIDRVRQVLRPWEDCASEQRASVATPPVVGLDQRDCALAEAIGSALEHVGARMITPTRLPGPASHVELAARGAQVVISLCGAGAAPLGSPISPVIAIARDGPMFAALRSDFDIDGVGYSERVVAEEIARRVVDVFNGESTAAERRGAGEMVLERLAVTM